VPLSDAPAALLRAVLEQRDALVDRATDKVFYESPDLAGKRSRTVTRILVERVFACSEALLFRGDASGIGVFIDQVTAIRAEDDYHVSTLLAGFRSFRFAIEDRVRALAGDPWVAWELMVAADEAYALSAARAADLLVERQQAALHARRGHVERENAKLAAELRVTRETASTLRAELDASALAALQLEQELRDRTETIQAVTEGDRRAREILERMPRGPERIEALRELRRDEPGRRPGTMPGTEG
jgi:hypothetical protein